MKKSPKVIALLLSMALLLTACGSKATSTPAPTPTVAPTEAAVAPTDAPATGSLAYKGELEIMHFSTSEESAGNGGSDGFRTINTQWDAAHPDIKLVQTVLANDEFKSKIATLAGADDLPDVFLLQGMNTKTWADQGIILDLTDIIKNSPYADTYDMSKLFPFTADGKTYAFPVLTEGSCDMVLYDKALWAEAGFSEFPKTWDDVYKAAEYFKGKNIDTIAFGNSGKWQLNSCFIDTLGDRFTGHQWYYDIIDKKGAAFTDKPFVDALAFTQKIFSADAGIFNKDVNAVNNEDAREYFISGDAAAFIGGNWDTSYVYATLKENNPEKLENTYLAVIPQPEGATGAQLTHSTGMGYGVAINAKLTGDKLAAAIDLAIAVTGPDFAKYVAENYALSAFSKVESVDLSKFDRFTQDFYNFYDNEGCEIYDSYLSAETWDVLNSGLQELINGTKTPEALAEETQKAYSSSY